MIFRLWLLQQETQFFFNEILVIVPCLVQNNICFLRVRKHIVSVFNMDIYEHIREFLRICQYKAIFPNVMTVFRVNTNGHRHSIVACVSLVGPSIFKSNVRLWRS